MGGDALDLDPQLPERKIKGYVQMDKGEERFKDKVPDNPLHDDMQNPNEVGADALEAMMNGVKLKDDPNSKKRLTLNEMNNDVIGAMEKGIKPKV